MTRQPVSLSGFFAPDYANPLELAWGPTHTALSDGWVYAEAKAGVEAHHPQNHAGLFINDFRLEISCCGYLDSGLANHGSVFAPVKEGDKFRAENGEQTKLAFLFVRENAE
jgi:hypothetical protein